jgi:hypothetical protein
MIITVVNSRKAQALQILDSAKRKYLEIGKQISYKIMNENPLDNVSNIEILPDDVAKQLIPRLSKFKSDVFSNGDTDNKPDTKAEANLRQAIQEILTKTYFKK